MNTVLLMMGGTGTRFGASRPKQYTIIGDAPLFSYIVRAIDETTCIDRLIVVSHKDWASYADEWCKKTIRRVPFDVVPGGENRSESVRCGLRKLSEYAEDGDVVLMHDATHPYFDPEGTEKVIEAVREYGGATLASKNYDTVYRVGEDGLLEKIEPRDLIVAGASPEGFRFRDIFDIYEQASDEELACMTSAGAIALAHNIPMKVVPTAVLNLKITYPGDMKLFRKLYDSYFFPETPGDF